VDRFEIIGLTLVMIAGIPIVILLWQIGRIAWGLAIHSLRPAKPFETAETALGIFTFDGGKWWSGEAQFPSQTITVSVMDAGHAPRSSFLDRLPGIVENLPALESAARKRVDRISEQYTLCEISDGPDVDFALGFSFDDDAWGETVYVSFLNDEVVGWDAVD
jgi:hypothetical protein